jgi:ribosomal protein L11 methyltransferase
VTVQEIHTWKVSLTVAEAMAPAAEEALSALGGEDHPPTFASFEADEKGYVWTVEAYYFGNAPEEQAIDNALQAFGASWSLTPVEDADWVGQSLRLLAPVRVGRFFVHGRHDADKIPPFAAPLEIEAGQAFGSGNHETTQSCLAAIDWLRDRASPKLVWDVGCGSGILAIAMAKVWRRARVIASDIDPIAVRVARQNAGINRVAAIGRPIAPGRIAFITAAGLAAPQVAGCKPDLLVANILLNPLIKLAPAIAASLTPDGVMVLSGILQKQEAALMAAYRGQGFFLLKRFRRNGWSALVLTR